MVVWVEVQHQDAYSSPGCLYERRQRAKYGKLIILILKMIGRFGTWTKQKKNASHEELSTVENPNSRHLAT